LGDKVLENALDYVARLESEPAAHLDQAVVDPIFKEITGILLGLGQAAKEE